MVKTSLADLPFHLYICQLIRCTLYNSFALKMSFQIPRITVFFVFLLLFFIFISKNCLPYRNTWVHHHVLVGFHWSIFRFLCGVLWTIVCTFVSSLQFSCLSFFDLRLLNTLWYLQTFSIYYHSFLNTKVIQSQIMLQNTIVIQSQIM